MSQNNQHLASQRKRPISPGNIIFMVACLALPAVLYLVTSHPAFIVVFLSGMVSISVYITRVSRK